MKSHVVTISLIIMSYPLAGLVHLPQAEAKNLTRNFVDASTEAGHLFYDNFEDAQSPLLLVKSTQYNSLNAAVAAIGSTRSVLVVVDKLPLTGNCTLPATLEIHVIKSGVIDCGPNALNINGPITISGTITGSGPVTATSTVMMAEGIIDTTGDLTINGPLLAGPYQIFNSSAKVTLSSSSAAQAAFEWFGAKGDGISDDSVAVYNALSSGLALNGNNRLFYVTSSGLAAKSAKKYFPIYHSIYNSSFRIMSNQEADGTRFEIVSNDVIINNCTFSETNKVLRRSNVYGTLSAFNASNFLLNNVKVTGSNGAAIHIRSNCTQFNIVKPYIRNAKADGIHIQRGSRYFSIIEPDIADVEDDAIGIVGHGRKEGYDRPGFGNIIGGTLGNQSNGAVGSGIALIGCTDVQVMAPIIRNTGLSGIRITDFNDIAEGAYTAQNIVVESADIKNSGITSNRSAGLVKDGISIFNASNVKIENAMIEQSHDNGIVISESGLDIQLIDSVISRSGYRGIWLTASTSNTSARMEIWRADHRKGSATTIENQYTTIKNVRVAYSGTDGVYLDGTSKKYIHNAAIKDIYVTDSNVSNSAGKFGVFISGVENSVFENLYGGHSASATAITSLFNAGNNTNNEWR